ncbi:MAG: pyrimidine dimer DNA glycosylase/endonuclease V [Candidatus Omnitrophica bacterium]|nr:pyrimidine dimer DNA glycosylase/endonuclease V [Candidatus Omnitrophota bacterium]
MRLWSLHPKYLDAKGIVALWREALLAQKVLQGKTKGYTHHPQLDRFRDSGDARNAIARYLEGVWEEADRRGYHFDKNKIPAAKFPPKIPVTRGQIDYEFEWLCRKLRTRDPARCAAVRHETRIEIHPSFRVKPGPVAPWERRH